LPFFFGSRRRSVSLGRNPQRDSGVAEPRPSRRELLSPAFASRAPAAPSVQGRAPAAPGHTARFTRDVEVVRTPDVRPNSGHSPHRSASRPHLGRPVGGTPDGRRSGTVRSCPESTPFPIPGELLGSLGSSWGPHGPRAGRRPPPPRSHRGRRRATTIDPGHHRPGTPSTRDTIDPGHHRPETRQPAHRRVTPPRR